MTRRSAVIIGAGAAGMSAAITLAECGLTPTVIDENANIGGQIYRQPSVSLATTDSPPREGPAARGAALMKRFHEAKDSIELIPNAKAWGVFESRQIAVSTADGWNMIGAERLILATGAYEFVPPFPGWTLPGVMTPGAAQLLVKSMHVLPGKRVLVAGTGPFLLVVASALHDAGMEVVGVVEAVTRAETVMSLPGLLGNLGMLSQGWRYWRKLRRAGIPIHTGHVIVAAEGDGGVERVRFAPCDADWRPTRSLSRAVDVDTLCVGYGFVPRTALAQLVDCPLHWNEDQGSWTPEADENLETGVENVWVAGDGAGVAGAVVAEYEGEMAGLAVARRAGALDEPSFQRRRKRVARSLARLRRFRRTLDRLSRPRSGLCELASGDTVICRCEELTRDEFKVGIDAGCTTNRTLKVATRIAMGRCQGRMCWPAMARFVAQQTGKKIEEVGPLSVRPPCVPVTLGMLADGSCAAPQQPIREGGAH
jgi:NADPH-dependent 2,4-dienoyl-CoA reductase/sulfur reductase-like enzyme